MPYVIQRTVTIFNRDQISAADLTVLNKGKWGNAEVFLYNSPVGKWVLKDFAGRPWLVRNTIGRYMIKKEMGALSKLAGIAGIPDDVFKLDSYCVCYRYVEGQTLRDCREALSADFFLRLEELVRCMHEKGLAHLDLRYRRNILVTNEMRPAIIDFQSGVHLDKVPRIFHDLLKDVDISGVYKHWKRFSPETMGAEREKRLADIMRIRKFWVFRGYMVQRLIKKIKGGGGNSVDV